MADARRSETSGPESSGPATSRPGSGDTRPRRAYRSTVREESARRTRQAVIDAARELFIDRGYGGTSFADIAARAGVARPTAFTAFGSKPALLRQVLDQALAGDDEPVPVADRPWYRPVREADSQPGVLSAYAAVCALIGGRAAGIFEAVRRAVDDAPELAEVWETLLRNRRVGASTVVDRVRSLGSLRPGLAPEQAVDIVWLFNDPGHYHALVDRCGWPVNTFQGWLTDQLVAALLPPPARHG